MISYSKKAIGALAFLWQPYNDIDVYVEDTTCRNMWQVLLDRMLGGQAKVGKIFPLGARHAVIEACKNDQGDGGRPRLYIIDGDFDAVLRRKPPKLRYLYRLGVYCSENLVLTEAAAVEVALEHLTNNSRDEVEAIIGFSPFLDDVVHKLTPLFVMYIAARILDANVETTGFHVNQLLTQKSRLPKLSATKIKSRIVEVRRQLEEVNLAEEVKSAIEKAEKLIPNSTVDIAKLISGKTYLLPLLLVYLQKKVRFSGKGDQLKTRLARHCELDVDPALLRAVRASSKATQVPSP